MIRTEQRITQKEKNRHDKEWYKSEIDRHDKLSGLRGGEDDLFTRYRGNSDFAKMRANYMLMENEIDNRDYDYVTSVWGDLNDAFPAKIVNRDITSNKIFAVLNLAAQRPFKWSVGAINPEATTRKEQAEFYKTKEFSIQFVKKIVESGQDPTQSEDWEEQTTYLQRKNQDPAEFQATQILNILIKKDRLKDKFTKGLRHGLVGGREIYYVGEEYGEPTMKVVNPLYFDYDKSPDVDYIEDGQWAVAEYRLTPHEIISFFADELENKDIDDIYDWYNSGGQAAPNLYYIDEEGNYSHIRVLHVVWKSLRKIGFLQSATGERVVNEDYKLNKEAGDISIEWKWIPEVHEGWKIGRDKYVRMRPIPNQHRDLENLYVCKLPYFGVAYNYENGQITTLIDRIRPYQHLYNVFWYRMEMMAAHDKGKILMMNPNAISTPGGSIDIKEWLYMVEATHFGFLDPNQEGLKGTGYMDMNTLVREVDMSTGSDITRYQALLEYLDTKAGETAGIPRQLLAQIAERDAVQNVNRVINLASNILSYYFQKHEAVMENVLNYYINYAKTVFSVNKKTKLSYQMDDMTLGMLELDLNLLDFSTFGLFINDRDEIIDTQTMIQEATAYAMQSKSVLPSSIIGARKATSIREAEEIIRKGEETFQKMQMQMQEQATQGQLQIIEAQNAQIELKHQLDMEKTRYVETTKTDRELKKQAILALGFAQNSEESAQTQDNITEVAGVLNDRRKLDIDEKRLEQEGRLREKEIEVKKMQAGKKPTTKK